jgi:hypothetical protein
MLKQIVVWLLLMWIWGALIYYSAQLANVFGRSAWADSYLWWTKNAIILVWFFLIILAVLIMFGVFTVGTPLESVTWEF